MSRTNVQVLIATALLGVLLVVVLRLSGRLAERLPADSQLVVPVAGSAGSTKAPGAGEDSPVSVTSYDEFVTTLDQMGRDGRQVLADSARWYQSRGFLGAAPLLGIGTDDAPLIYYESLDDATLSGLMDRGDMAAAQALASRQSLQEPLKAIHTYETAAGLGSTYALLQLASLYDTFSTIDAPELDNWRDQARTPDTGPGSLKLRALAYLLAALRDGGPPLASERLLEWAGRLDAVLPAEQRAQACISSEKLFVEFSSQRRRHGLPPVRSKPPPAFLTVPGLSQRLGCEQTSSPYQSTLDLTDCTARPALTGHDQAALLIVCR